MSTTPRRIRTVPRLAPRRKDAHKGDFGRVLVVGGSAGMIGAPALAANAALRGGAGLVTVAVPAGIQQTVAGLAPCATSVPLPSNEAGLIDDDGTALHDAIARADVVAFGPGMSAGGTSLDGRWYTLLRACAAKPVVIDADGLNLLSRLKPAGLAIAGSRWVLTPHPGEMASLLKCTTADIQADRLAAAMQCWGLLNGIADRVIVLKGAGTVVTDGRSVYVNRTGNPGMATGGSGDVLTGTIAALIGQGISLFDAAVLGVHVHGLAGDRAARRIGQVSLTAADLLDFLPAAFKAVQGRR